MADNKKVEVQATSMSCSSLMKLFEQYDQAMASVEVDLDVHDKLINLMREYRATNEQQLSSANKNTEKINKELQLLDEKTNELIQGAISQGEKIEQLKFLQEEIVNGISDAGNCLLAAQNAARDDMAKLHSMERDVQEFFENNLATPVFSDVASKLENYQKDFSSKVQDSIDHLASLVRPQSIMNEAEQLENLEKVLKEMRMDVANLEQKTSEVEAQCLVHHEKIVKANASMEEEKQRRNAASEKYKQHKDRIAELTLSLERRENDKRLLSERVNSAEQELIRNKERLEMKREAVENLRQELNKAKKELAEHEQIMKLEREKHEQKVQEMKEAHEADMCASKAHLMALREKGNEVLVQIEKAHDDLNKKAEWEAHRKLNEEAERKLEQLKEKKAQLQHELHEKESHRNVQLSRMEALKVAFQENKLGARKKREILMAEIKRVNEEILDLKHRIAEEELRSEVRQKKIQKQLEIATNDGNIGDLMHCPGQGGNFRQDDETLSRKSLSANEEGTVQKQRCEESDKKVEKNHESDNDIKDIKMETCTEEMVVERADPRKLVPEKKFTEDGKFPLSEIEKSSLCTDGNGGGGTQISTKHQDEPGPSKTGRQARKKRVPAKQSKAHNSALALFDDDISASTIEPMYASTPLLQKRNESLFSSDSVEKTQKKRGRPREKKAPKRPRGKSGYSKTAKKKDAYELDSDSD